MSITSKVLDLGMNEHGNEVYELQSYPIVEAPSHNMRSKDLVSNPISSSPIQLGNENRNSSAASAISTITERISDVQPNFNVRVSQISTGVLLGNG